MITDAQAAWLKKLHAAHTSVSEEGNELIAGDCRHLGYSTWAVRALSISRDRITPAGIAALEKHERTQK